MKLLRFAFICFIFFAVLITGFSLLIPSHIRISRATDINTSQDSVLMLIQNPEKWKNWYPGADSASFIYNNGKITGIATGNNNGIKLETISDSLIVAANADKRMRMGWQIFPAATPNTTTIQWYMNFKLRWYPWEKFSSLLLEKRYGPMMEKGLSVLKKFAEKK
ncbi:MAG TPA: SRPBCC family protein [Chitinophagaceae bacterium]|jgi:hypothetical protein|nr:SRPBCC family protein [Chitinophagaceae bacterium]